MLRSSLIVLVVISAAAFITARFFDDRGAPPPPVASDAAVAVQAAAPEGQPISGGSGSVALPYYRLHGTLEGSTPSTALIAAEPGEPATSYRVGEKLPGGAVLEAVLPRFAVLEFAGERYKLLFPDGTTDAGAAAQDAGTTSLPSYGLRDGEENLPPRNKIAPEAGEALRRSATGPELTAEQRAKHEALALED